MASVREVTDGVVRHFPQRASEWLMVWPCFWMGVALNVQRDMFGTSPSFEYLGRWLEETEWAFFVLMCALIRLTALTINGTFDSFRHSPHIRIVAAFASCFFWFQFTLGFIAAAYSGGGSLSAVVAYSTFVLAEVLNVYRAARDLGQAVRGT